MKPYKTKLRVKVDPHRNWLVIDQEKLQQIAEMMKAQADLLTRAAMTPCETCGTPGVVVYKNMLLKVCYKCAIDRLNTLFEDGDDDIDPG